jgi:transcriptional regulator with XRE-family HTH domain
MVAPGTTRLRQEAERRARAIVRSVGDEFRVAREDANLSQRQVAQAAGLSQSHLAEIEAGTTEPSISMIVAVAAALGGDASLRFFPGTGPTLRDRIQAPMVEAVLRILHPRWSRFPELPVRHPVKGVIDLVLVDPAASLLVATEFHSQLRRLEQQIRWARDKADALGSTSIGKLALRSEEQPITSRLLVLRSTRATRSLATEFESTLAAAYPASTSDVVASLTGDSPWPGAGIVWVRLDGRRTHVMPTPPPGVRLGRS